MNICYKVESHKKSYFKEYYLHTYMCLLSYKLEGITVL